MGGLLSKTAYAPVVTIGGQGATVSFSGLAPGFVGLNQINVVAPSGTPSGDDDLVVTVNESAGETVKLPLE